MRLIHFILSLVLIFPAFAQAQALTQGPVPERRVILWRSMDFPGGDIQTVLDSTLRACERACLLNEDCGAYTFNTKASACFLKSGSDVQEAFEGAFSAQILPTNPRYLAQADARWAELDFLRPADLEQAGKQVANLPHDFVVGGWSIERLVNGMRDAEDSANLVSAMRYAAGLVVQTDSPADWLEFARLSLAIQTSDTSERSKYRRQGLHAAINAYLRAALPAQQASALVHIATGLESQRRGRDMIPALRLAMALSPRDDTAELLDKAIGKYGFRVTDHRVDADRAEPRICAEFSEPLVSAGRDYSPYVQSVVSGLAIEASGRDLCITGVEHGKRYRVTLRTGLPAASGEELAKPATITAYVRDRSPAVSFPGRAYVLPASNGAGLPIVGVNLEEVDLTLYRISDRNIVRALRDSYFARPISPWELNRFTDGLAEEVWRGTGLLESELNRDVTTNLPIGEAVKGRKPGIYALHASVPEVDQYKIPPATQWFVISDIGIATMLGSDGLHVFTRSLGSADPMVGAEVELVSRSNSVLGTLESDARGYTHFPEGLTTGHNGAEPALVVVRKGEDMAFLSLTDPEFDLTDRGVEGRPSAPPIDLFATTDRGVYRAGDVVHATVLARDAKAEALAGLPVTAVLRRPDGVEYSRHLSRGEGAGGHVFTLPLGGGVPRGTWRLNLYTDPDAPALASKTFLVEDFLPERIDFDLSLPDGPIRTTDRPDLTLAARYLFGAPGADLAIEGDVIVRPSATLEDWPGFRFGRYDARSQPEWGSLPGGIRTNEAGNAVLAVSLPEVEAKGQPLLLNLNVRVSEGSGRPVERRLSRVITPDSAMIGIRPGFEDDLPEDSEATFQLAAIGTDLQRTDMEVGWTVNRVSTRYQWYTVRGRWYWDPVTTRKPVASGTAMLSAGELTGISAPVEWGHYELVVEGTGEHAGLTSSVEYWAGWYGAADAASTPDMLEVSLDAESYRPGDTATLRMVPRAPGKVLVAVMSNRLIDMKAVDVTAGENTVTLPVTDEWGAGAYVTATLIQPMDEATGRGPARALGLAHASVDPGAHQLSAAFEVAAETRPRGPLDVALKVEGALPGETVQATIAAIDVGILNVTGFASPDPSDHYFGQRRLGMGFRDLYGRLIDGHAGVAGEIREGGDGGLGGGNTAPPPTEVLMAQFSGPLTVGADGYARTSFDLPEFNGQVRLMAVVWSRTGVGQASQDVLVRDPVVLTASLPRFMAPGDEARLLLELVHAAGPAGETKIEVSADGVAINTLSLPASFPMAAKGTRRFELPLTALSAGTQSIDIALTTPGGEVLTKSLTLPVQVNDPEVVRVSRFQLAAGKSFTFDDAVFSELMAGTGKATLTAGQLARFGVPALLDRLDRYPYGCTEQLTSRAMPLLYFGTVAEAMGLTTDEDIPARISKALDRILSNQASAGSFGLWRPDSGDLWLDAYVSDFLSRARAKGFDVPDTAFRAAMDNLRSRVNYAADFDSGGQDIAYALYVLAREGAASMGDLRYYADEKGDAFSTALAAAQLGAALASYGDTRRADEMFLRASRKLVRPLDESKPFWRIDYGTNLRDAAAVLTLATEAGSEAVNKDALAIRVAAGRSDHYSTQEATWSLLAANALIGESTGLGLTVNGENLTGPLVEMRDAQVSLAAAEIGNSGTGPTELTLTTFGVPTNPEPAGGRGFTIERRYFTMQGDPVETDRVKQGDRLVAVLTITPHGRAEGRLMVNDPLPAGFEIENPHILQSGDVKTLEWLDLNASAQATEFRQERFLAAIDWRSEKAFRLAYQVRAITPGVYRHPAASVEDMYRPSFRARSETGQVTIEP